MRAHHHLDDCLVASRDGDDCAFADLYATLAPGAHALAARIVLDDHHAEEVVQEVFLEVWRTAAAFDPDLGSARGWVMALVRRRAIDRVRSVEARSRRDSVEAGRPALGPEDPTAHDAHTALDAQTVRRALDRLTGVQRQAVELAYFEELSHRDVARQLELPLGTVKARIRRSLVVLGDQLVSPDLDEEPPSAP